MNLLATMLLFWAGLCALSVLATALIVVAEIRASDPDFRDTGEAIVSPRR